MPDRCVVGGCSSVPGGGVSLHKFPKDERQRRIWIRFVDNTRADFVCTKYSAICSDHFEDDCFDKSYELKETFGLKSNKTSRS